MICYVACFSKFKICYFLAKVTLETSQVYYDNWYHDCFWAFSPKFFFFLSSITFKTITMYTFIICIECFFFLTLITPNTHLLCFFSHDLFKQNLKNKKIFHLGLLNILCQVGSQGGWLGLGIAKFWN